MKLNINQIKVFFLLMVFCLVGLCAFAGTNEDEWKERLIKKITAQLKEQMRQNAIHESKGESHRNNYVVSINQTRDWQQKFDWVDERGFEQNKMFREEELEDFNTRLIDVNSNGTLVNTKTALYVVVVNEWELLLETTITPFEKITTLDQLGSRAREEAFDALKIKMSTVSAAVENEIESAKGLHTVHVHLMANIRVYDQPDVAKNKVTPKQFTVVTFPESLVRYGLKGVSHIKTLGGKAELIKENIRLFGQHFQKPVDVNLAYDHVIPLSERGNIEKALEKPLRIIGEKPNDPKRAVYDYSNLISDDTKLAALEQLCKDLRKGDDNDIYLKTFYTDYRMSSTQLDEILNYTKSLGRNDLVAWVHLENAAGEVTSGLFFGPGLEQRLTKDFLDHTKELLIQSVKVYHKFSSIPVKGLAWVAGGLSKVISLTEISPAYYDPSLGGAYDPTIFLFYYIGQSTAELGSGIIANTIVSDDDDFAEKIGGALLKDLGVKQYEFALVTGFWNGIVEELRGVADATEMLCHAYTDPPTIDQVNEVMHSILNGSAFNAIGTQLKDRYTSDNFSDYQKLHHAGKDIIAAATLFIGVGEISGAAKVSKAFAGLAKASRTIELISLTRYAFNAARGVQLYKLGSQARMFIRLVGDEANVVIKLVNSAGDILKNTDFSLLKEVSYSVPGYGTGRGIVFVDPSENLKGAIHEIRQLVTDRYGNKAVEITDDAGKHLGVDAKGPASLLDEGAEIATLLSSLRTKVGEAHWPSFAKDFEKNVEMLRKFDGEEGLVDAWEVFYKSGINEFTRKNVTKLDELKGLLKKNNLGWRKIDFENFLARPADKPWDNLDEVISALKRTSEAKISGLTLSYKKFPQSKDGSYSYVLEQAKRYQGVLKFNGDKLLTGSGDANLSFDYNGVSFDNLIVGKLIDNKYGHGSTIFKETEELYSEIPGLDDFIEDSGKVIIVNQKRVNSIIAQANRQLIAVGSSNIPIEWHISTNLGAKGIAQIFKEQGITGIVVKHINP